MGRTELLARGRRGSCRHLPVNGGITFPTVARDFQPEPHPSVVASRFNEGIQVYVELIDSFKANWQLEEISRPFLNFLSRKAWELSNPQRMKTLLLKAPLAADFGGGDFSGGCQCVQCAPLGDLSRPRHQQALRVHRPHHRRLRAISRSERLHLEVRRLAEGAGETDRAVGAGAPSSWGRAKCANCHVPPNFTDFTYDNLGVPRNPTL